VTIRTDDPNSNEFIRTRGYAVGLSAAMYVLETSPASRVQTRGARRGPRPAPERATTAFSDLSSGGRMPQDERHDLRWSSHRSLRRWRQATSTSEEAKQAEARLWSTRSMDQR
jgi:hypothetical protein